MPARMPLLLRQPSRDPWVLHAVCREHHMPLIPQPAERDCCAQALEAVPVAAVCQPGHRQGVYIPVAGQCQPSAALATNTLSAIHTGLRLLRRHTVCGHLPDRLQHRVVRLHRVEVHVRHEPARMVWPLPSLGCCCGALTLLEVPLSARTCPLSVQLFCVRAGAYLCHGVVQGTCILLAHCHTLKAPKPQSTPRWSHPDAPRLPSIVIVRSHVPCLHYSCASNPRMCRPGTMLQAAAAVHLAIACRGASLAGVQLGRICDDHPPPVCFLNSF
jgi:hypothetical protein